MNEKSPIKTPNKKLPNLQKNPPQDHHSGKNPNILPVDLIFKKSLAIAVHKNIFPCS